LRDRALVLCLLAAAVLCPAHATAQTGPAAASLLPPPGECKLSIALLGGWASFSQKSVNDVIRFDNLLLTTPVSEGGAGLDKGLDQLTDGLSFGVEIRYRLSSRWSAVAGFERLKDRTRLDFDFTYDPGTGPEESFIKYEADAWPIYAGVIYSFRFTERLTYGVGVAAIYFPSSRLYLSAERSSLPIIEQEGTASGLGALIYWTGDMALGSPFSVVGSIRMRLGDVGDPKDSSGDKINNPYTGEPLTVDWSGVDILIGLMIDLF
ncbi:MAG: hypothetical protein KAT18_05810, partial [Candidatus Latescibacteria bacterium]|nr:hypothetical protein [Candidatus Latescibacterota bacterium]